MFGRYFFVFILILGLIFSPMTFYSKTVSPARRSADIKSSVVEGINTYLNQFNGTCFAKAISLGDSAKFSAALNKNINRYYVGKAGEERIKEMSPDAKSFHHTYKLIGMTADLVFPFDPQNLPLFQSSTNNEGYLNRQTMMHEATHHIEWLNGVKESSKTILGYKNPRSERNTDYQDFVINALVDWRETEAKIIDKREDLPNALNKWKIFEETLAKLEKGSAAAANPPDANLQVLTGFNVKFESINKFYQSGACGEDLKTFAMLADLLPKMDTNLDLTKEGDPSFGREGTIELNPDEKVSITASAVDSAREDKILFIELKPELNAQFYWNAVGLETQKGKKFQFTAGKESQNYQVKIDLRVPFNNREYSIARANFNLITKGKEEEPSNKILKFGGTITDIWEGGNNERGFDLKRQNAKSKGTGECKWEAQVHSEIYGRIDPSFVYSEKDIQEELDKFAQSSKAWGKTVQVRDITISGFKGKFADSSVQFYPGGWSDGGFRADGVSAEGRGWVIKDKRVVAVGYNVGGSGCWENSDKTFLMNQAKAAQAEAKALIDSLTLIGGVFKKTPYNGPKLDGSDMPKLSLTVSPNTKTLKKGDVVTVQAFIENEENAEQPLNFVWTGEHTGSGESVKFTADKAGKQTLSVSVDGVGSASVEFEVAPVKAEIVQISPVAKKITAGTPVSFSAKLLSGDAEINGNYVYRWQPQPEAKFEPAEGAAKQTKAVFTKEGLTRVWVQILERKGEILQTVAESPHIEIEVVAPIKKPSPIESEANTKSTLSTNKLNEAKTIIKKGQLDESIVLVDEAVKINPKNLEAANLSKKWKKERTTIKAQLTKVRTLIDQQKYLEASKELIVAKNLHNLYPPVLEIEKELNDKWTKYEWGVNQGIGEIRMANEARKFKEALELAQKLRSTYKFIPETEKTLKSYEDWARTHEAEKNRQRVIVLQGEAKFNAYDYEGAIKDFDVMWGSNHNEYWGMYDSEPKKYGDLRNEAIRRRDRISKLLTDIANIAENPSFDKKIIQNGVKYADEVLQLQPNNTKAQEYKALLTERLNRGQKGFQYDQAIKKGDDLTNAKKYGEAVKEYEKAIKADGKSAEAYQKRGNAKEESGDLKGALSDYEKAIKLDSNNSKAIKGRDRVNAKLNPPTTPKPTPKPTPTPAKTPKKPIEIPSEINIPGIGKITIPGGKTKPTPTPAKTPTPTVPSGKEAVIFNNMNIYGVQNKPTSLTQFTITKPHVITYIMTYHWNNARGNQKAGFIGFYNERGERFGSWQSKGTSGQGGVPNANWEVFPNITIPAGTYTIVDSSEETWSQNPQSQGKGMAIVKGYPTSGGTPQTTINKPPNTTPKTPPSYQGAMVLAIFQNRSNEAVHIFAEGDNFGPHNKISAGGNKEVSVKMSSDGRIKFFAGRNGVVVTSKIWTGDPSDTNRYPKVIFDGSQLIITTGLR